jgi:histidinol-phosphate aminotransferase
MEIAQTAKGLFETGFDDDMPQETQESILRLFPTTDGVYDHLLELRDNRGFRDMKRGELYPEIIGGVTRLRRTIANVYEIDFMQAQPNFACNGCIDTFLSHVQRLELTNPDRNGFLVTTPTYFRYIHKVEALRMKLIDIPLLGPECRYPVDQVIGALRERRPTCFFIVTPNNPTGIPIPDEELFEILDNVPEDVCIGVDRTCANVDPEVSTKDLLHRYPHKKLAIFHSFSKYHGMSHLRIGFSVFSNKDFASEVNRYLPFGLNLEALLKATYLLMTEGELRPMPRILEHIKGNQTLVREFLQRHQAYSITNFKSNYAQMLLPAGIDSRRVNDLLLSEGIFVMPGHDFPLPNDKLVRLHTGGHPKYLQRTLELLDRL